MIKEHRCYTVCMCATCGDIGKYGQNQPEAIKADKLKLAKVRARMEARAKQTSK